MLRTRFSIAAFVLAAVFLTAAQVQADEIASDDSNFVEFTFHLAKNYGLSDDDDYLQEIADSLTLTATNGTQNDLDGVVFKFVSTWTGEPDGEVAFVNYVNKPSHYGGYSDAVFLTNTYQVLGSDGDVIADGEPLVAHSHGLRASSDGLEASFFIPYKTRETEYKDYGWDDFLGIVFKNDFGFHAYISEDGSRGKTAMFATDSKTPSNAPGVTPEPATLLILGGGLAGLGIAARRRKK